jgi:hypothetical protein
MSAGLADIPKLRKQKTYQSTTTTGGELVNSHPKKPNSSSAAQDSVLSPRLLVASVPPATRYPSPGCYAEPGDSRESVE